jgi:uncharacterized protein (DUF427 family)
MSQTADPHGDPHGDPHAGLILERMTLAPAGKRLRAVFGGEVVAESDGALVLSEKGYPPRVYFPPADVRGERLAPTEHTTRCPWKGQAAYWSVSAGGQTLENGAWAYPAPLPELAAIAGFVSFYEAVAVEG